MKRLHMKIMPRLVAALWLLIGLTSGNAWAVIDGLTGANFTLTAKAGYIATPDGNSVLMWGYANGAGLMQYPGPTLIVNQGASVTITLNNTLAVPVSIVFPGQQGVTTSGGTPGVLTAEAAPGGSVTYTFTAARAGTYLYHSGTRPDLQTEMGLVGALIVRPTAADPLHQAYEHANTHFDREYLFLLAEMDKTVHEQVEAGQMNSVDMTKYHPTLWFINGRNGHDTLAEASVPWMPHQPYNTLPRMHPGEKLLMRVIGAGRDLHPFHHHGNHALLIARDGRLLESTPGAGPDLASADFTVKVVPGETYDAIFEWTGKGLGWDIYGTGPDYAHNCTDGNGDSFDDATSEYCPDHGKPLPTSLPNQLDLTFGGMWTGSPYLGLMGALPPGQGGMNPSAGFTYMWHSHTEKELTNDDLFPGGMMSMLIIEAPGVPIP